MIFILAVLTIAYVVLGTLVLNRYSTSVTAQTLAGFLILCVLSTSGWLIVSLEQQNFTALAAAEGAIGTVALIFAIAIFYPVALASAYGGSRFAWLTRTTMWVAIIGLVSAVVVAIAVMVMDLEPLMGQRPFLDSISLITSPRLRLLRQVQIFTLVTGLLFTAGVMLVAWRTGRARFWPDVVRVGLAYLAMLIMARLIYPTNSQTLFLLGIMTLPLTASLMIDLYCIWRPPAGVLPLVETKEFSGLVVLTAHNRIRWFNRGLEACIPCPDTLLRTWSASDFFRETPFAAAVEALLKNPLTPVHAEVGSTLYELTLQQITPTVRVIAVRDVTTIMVRADLQKRQQALFSLIDLGSLLAETISIDTVFHSALDQLHLISHVTDAAIYIDQDPASDYLNLVAQMHHSNRAALPESLRKTGTIVGDSFTRRTELRVANDSDHSAVYVLDSAFALALPLIAQDKTSGVLFVATQGDAILKTEDYALIRAISRQIAIATQNTILLANERHQRQIAQALQAAVSAASRTQHFEANLGAMLQHMLTVLPFDLADLYLLTTLPDLRHHITFDMRDGRDYIPNENALHVNATSYSAVMAVLDGQPRLLDPVGASDIPILPGANKTAVILSLRHMNRPLGILVLRSDQPRAFSKAQIPVAQAFADQIALSTANARMFSSEQKQINRTSVIENLFTLFTGTTTINELFEVMMVELARVLDYDTASILYLKDEFAIPGYWRSKFRSNPPNEILPLTELRGTRRIIETGLPVLISDTATSDLWFSNEHRNWGNPFRYPIASWIGAPLMVRGQIIGILNIDGLTPDQFDEDDLHIVHTVANRLGAAIESERLVDELRRSNQQLQTLNTLIVTTSRSLALQPLIDAVLDEIIAQFKKQGGMVHLIEPDGHYRLYAARGLPEVEQQQFATLRPDTLITSSSGHLMPIPITLKDKLIGVFHLLDSAHNTVSPADFSLLINVSHQFAVALENAHMYENALRSSKRASELRSLSLAITAVLDPNEILELVVREATAIYQVDCSFIWLMDGEDLVGHVYYDACDIDRSPFIGLRLRAGSFLPLQQKVSEMRMPVYINRIDPETRAGTPLESIMKTRSIMGVPMMRGDTLTGILTLVSETNPYHFNDQTVEQISLMGMQITLALENAMLFGQANRRYKQLQLVSDIGRYAASVLSSSMLLDGVCRHLYAALHYELIAIYTFQQNDRSTYNGVLYRSGQKETVIAPVEPPATVQIAISTAEPVLRSGADLSELAVPLIGGGEVSGALYISTTSAGISEDDFAVLQPLAAQIAISLVNASLFEAIYQQTIELENRVEQRTRVIREQQERIEAILSSVADAVIVTGLSGEVIMSNPVARALMEPAQDGEIALRLRQVITALSLQEKFDHEDIIELGEMTLQAKAARVMESTGPLGTVIVLRDITRLQEVDRLKTNFVSQVSHELRTPMANIKLYLNLIRRGSVEKRSQYMDVVERESQRLERLISNLLDISRIDYARRSGGIEAIHAAHEVLDVAPIVQQVVQNHLPQAAAKNQTVSFTPLESPRVRIKASRDQITQVFTNLLGNAIAYTPDEGRIEIRDNIGIFNNEKCLIMEIIDNGVGITPEDQKHIFERFYRGTKPEQVDAPGTGLGLAITKEIVEMHRGTIEVESSVGFGSTFRIRLPVLED